MTKQRPVCSSLSGLRAAPFLAFSLSHPLPAGRPAPGLQQQRKALGATGQSDKEVTKMSISKRQLKQHDKAMALLNAGLRHSEEYEAFFEGFHEGAVTSNKRMSAHFTPFYLARDFALEAGGSRRIIDLCAGIGTLSLFVYWASQWDPKDAVELVCVERCPEFVEIGKKLLPQATWICGDVTDRELMASLGRFDFAMSNPPFGSMVKPTEAAPFYTGSEFEYTVIDIAADIADRGAFIIPASSSPFVFSGAQCYQHIDTKPNFRGAANLDINRRKYGKFHKETQIELMFGAGIDCSYHRDDWKDVAPAIEIVTADFLEHQAQREQARKMPGLNECPLFAAA